MKLGICFYVFFQFALAIAGSTQPVEKDTSTVTTYFHVAKSQWNEWNHITDSIIAFNFENLDTLGAKNWKSKETVWFVKDGAWFYARLEVPNYLFKNSNGLWCTSTGLQPARLGHGYDTIKSSYWGSWLAPVKLNINTSPVGAEIYLIPHTIWMEKFDGKPWEYNWPILETYRLTKKTNISIMVDDYSFMVICRIGDIFKKVDFIPKSATEEPIQYVSFDLNEIQF